MKPVGMNHPLPNKFLDGTRVYFSFPNIITYKGYRTYSVLFKIFLC